MRKIYSFLKGMSAVKSLFLSLFCLWTVSSVSGQITVSSGGSYSTIQAAVTAAAPGATITVPAGVYNEGDIEITKPLTILGPQTGVSPNAANTRLSNEGAEAVIDIPVFPVSAGFHPAFNVRQSTTGSSFGVVIKGFTFKNGSPLQDGHTSYTPSTRVDVTFENNIVKNGQLIYGGYFWRDITINDNNFNNPTVFSGLDVGRADAVYILGGGNVNVTNNVINTSFVGILVKGQNEGTNAPITQINILKNRVSTTTEEAIQIGEQIVNGLVSQNVVYGASTVGGIRVYLPTITSRVDIKNNSVDHSYTGVHFTDGNASQQLYVNYNSFTNSTSGFEIISKSEGSSIVTGTLQATCNWLGTADCSQISNKVSGDVTYSPFLQNGIDNEPNTIGFQSIAPCTICCTLAATLASKTDVKCFGGNDGTASFNVTGGTASVVTYSLNGGIVTASSNPATGLVAGSYIFTIKDNTTGCTTTVPVTIEQPAAAISLSATTTDVKCYGGSTGAIDLTATGGTGTLTYSWTKAGTTFTSTSEDLTGLVAGTYTVLVTDANKCTTTKDFVVTQPAAALVATATGQQNIDCTHPTGSVTIGATGGTTNYSGTGLKSGLPIGKSTFTVTDANGCMSSIDVTITQTAGITVNAINQKNVLCFGGSTGSVEITATGGTAPLTGTGVKTGLAAGTYTYDVTDNFGCKGSVMVTITQPAAALVATATGQQNIDCTHPTGSVTIGATGGTTNYSGTGLKTGLPVGKSTFTVTDANGCMSSIDVTITQTAGITVNAINQKNVLCFGGSTGSVEITATGGTAPLTGTGIKSGLAAGTYTFDVTDGTGCKGSVMVTITQPAAALVATATGQQNIDCTHPTGSVTIGATGGTTSYSGTGLKTGLPLGKSTFTVTDANGCMSSIDVTITQTAGITVNAINQKNILCFGGSTGSVEITATGGTAPLTGTGVKTGLAAGTYTYDVTDNFGCKGSVMVTITQPAAALNITATPTNINCTTPGAIDVTVTGGTSTYTYVWTATNGGTIPAGQINSQDLSGLTTAGTYKVVVTDKNLCTTYKEVTITKTDCPPPVCTLKASITNKVDVTCFGGSNGSVTIAATGGTPSYTGTGTFSNLKAGNYSYKVKDSKGCEVYVSFYIDEPDELKAPFTTKPVSCKGASDGSVTFTITGGTAPYVIKNVTTGATNLSNPVTGLKAGTYSFLITDKKGCCKTVSVCITEPTTPCVIPCKVTVTTEDIPYCYCGSTKGSATFTFTGKAPFKYTITPCNISGTSSDNTEKVSLSEGNYTIKVTAADGCVSTANFTVDQTDPITGTIGVKLNTTFPGQKSNTIYVGYTTQYATLSAENIKGGTAPYKYQWYPSTGLATPNDDETKATPNCTTTYTLVVTDAKGCKFYKCVTIKVVDVRCGKYNNQVEICCKGKSLCVDKNLVSGYLATGSTLGSCGCDKDDDDDHDGRDRNWSAGSDEGAAGTSDEAKPVTTTSIGGVYPNPTGGIFRLSLEPLNVPVQIVVGDATGKPITTVSRINSTTAGQTVDFNLSNQPVGMYLVRIVQGQIKKTYKVFIVR